MTGKRGANVNDGAVERSRACTIARLVQATIAYFTRHLTELYTVTFVIIGCVRQQERTGLDFEGQITHLRHLLDGAIDCTTTTLTITHSLLSQDGPFPYVRE